VRSRSQMRSARWSAARAMNSRSTAFMGLLQA
jgi:hypothetical protein